MKINNKEIISLASVVLTLVLFLCLTVSADTRMKLLPKTPRGLTELFCKLDFGGARLGTLNYKDSGIKKFTIPSTSEFPNWDTDHVTLITDYRIIKTEQSATDASVTVSYSIIGSLSIEGVIDEKKYSLPYTFKFRRQQKQWLMIEPDDLSPKISIDTAIRHLKDKTEYRETIKKLKRMRKKA